ncbi:hypothetical protein [Phenylobacterium sp.]|jgi:hypothetical protein|uniref:hypothetical protein n=1 Tax=Phenylobacterium sp. TaxID=1871053 RepID=UPI002F4068D2
MPILNLASRFLYDVGGDCRLFAAGSQNLPEPYASAAIAAGLAAPAAAPAEEPAPAPAPKPAPKVAESPEPPAAADA